MKKNDIISAVNTYGYSSVETSLYSITIPLLIRDGEYHLLYEVRAETLRRQPNEICFPGGKIEANETAKTAAIRETMEELNINDSHIEITNSLMPMTIPFGVTIYPHVAFLDVKFEMLTYNEDEVQELFTVPLSYLMRTEAEEHMVHTKVVLPEDFPFEKIQNGRDYNWSRSPYNVYFLEYNHHIIWGLTAKITNEFIHILKKAGIGNL